MPSLDATSASPSSANLSAADAASNVIIAFPRATGTNNPSQLHRLAFHLEPSALVVLLRVVALHRLDPERPIRCEDVVGDPATEGLAERTVSKRLKGLKDQGYLTLDKKGGYRPGPGSDPLSYIIGTPQTAPVCGVATPANLAPEPEPDPNEPIDPVKAAEGYQWRVGKRKGAPAWLRECMSSLIAQRHGLTVAEFAVFLDWVIPNWEVTLRSKWFDYLWQDSRNQDGALIRAGMRPPPKPSPGFMGSNAARFWRAWDDHLKTAQRRAAMQAAEQACHQVRWARALLHQQAIEAGFSTVEEWERDKALKGLAERRAQNPTLDRLMAGSEQRRAQTAEAEPVHPPPVVPPSDTPLPGGRTSPLPSTRRALPSWPLPDFEDLEAFQKLWAQMPPRTKPEAETLTDHQPGYEPDDDPDFDEDLE